MRVGDSVLDEFVIEERLHASEGVEIFRGREIATAEPVAIEALLDLDASRLARFERDAESLAALARTETVSYAGHGVGEAAEAFVVLDWIPTEKIERRLARIAAIRAELAEDRDASVRSPERRLATPSLRLRSTGTVAACVGLIGLTLAGVLAVRAKARPPIAVTSAAAWSMALDRGSSAAPQTSSTAPTSAGSAKGPQPLEASACPPEALACAKLEVADPTDVDTFTLVPDAVALAQSVRPHAQLAEVRATGISKGTLDFTRGATAIFGMTAGLLVEAKGDKFEVLRNPTDFAWPVRITRCSVSLAYAAATMAGLPRRPPASLSFGGANVQDRLYFTVEDKQRVEKVYVDPRTCTGNSIALDLYDPYGH
jgi:hypothetical protein